MTRTASLLLLLLLPSPALADNVQLRDGRSYTGTTQRDGKRLKIANATRRIHVPQSQVGDASAKPPEQVRPPAPGEDTRARIARRYGPWLSPKALAALDVERVGKAEGAIGALIDARQDEGKLKVLFSERVTPLELSYPVWEALVRGGAGRRYEKEPTKVGGLQTLTLADGDSVQYLLRVPESYRHDVPTGLIVGLHGQGEGLGGMLAAWGRFAEAEGMLLVSVEYAVTGQEGYHHTHKEHATVLATVRDLSERFSLNADRVFVTGHSMGGHAAWDVALSHPDTFAGAIPLISSAFAFDDHYRRNARHVPVYCIQGETDVWTERCRKHTKQMIDWGLDVTYVEYVGRGHEGFYEEQPWIRPWIRDRRRVPYPERFELRAGRPTDLERYWVRLNTLRIKLFDQAPTAKVPKRAVATVKATVESKNTLRVDCKEAKSLTVFLADALVDFDKPIRIKVNRKQRFKGRVVRSPVHMLREFLRRGDRRMLFAASVDVDG